MHALRLPRCAALTASRCATGLEAGGKRPIAMLDGKEFNGAKAYKDAKLCNMMTVLELHRRYNASTGVSFTSMYPGCIAETALFRQKRGWFRWRACPLAQQLQHR